MKWFRRLWCDLWYGHSATPQFDRHNVCRLVCNHCGWQSKGIDMSHPK